jgi:methylglutaconyl-CoA hydratase
LFTQVYDNITELDLAVKDLATQLCSYNLEAMKEMKKMFWRGTDQWDLFLAEQAQISGRLVLSNFTKEKLKKNK